MVCEGKMQCHECAISSSCPSTTRVFVNYCGSMPFSLKEQINRARIDCRVRRRYQKYRGIQRTSWSVNNSVVFPIEEDVLKTRISI